LDDWKKKSKFLFSKGNINIYRLNWEDIIITKIVRLEERDIEDIQNILSRIQIDFEELKERYKKTTECAVGREKIFEFHFKIFEEKVKK
jgi:hypothetical protein